MKCYYVKDRYLRQHEFANSRDVPLVSLRRTTSNTTPGIGGGPRALHYNSYNKVGASFVAPHRTACSPLSCVCVYLGVPIPRLWLSRAHARAPLLSPDSHPYLV